MHTTLYLSEIDRLHALLNSRTRRQKDANWWWDYECERVLTAIRFAADPQTKAFYGYYGRPEIEAVRMVKQLVQRGRREGRIEREGL
jgi:hypothetical protein